MNAAGKKLVARRREGIRAGEDKGQPALWYGRDAQRVNRRRTGKGNFRIKVGMWRARFAHLKEMPVRF